MRSRAATVAAFVLAAVADRFRPSAQEVLVSAAASLADVMETIARAYEKRTGVRVVVNTGASNTLARQIAAGAAVDLFISADEAQMDAVRGEIVAGTRVDLLSNQLADGRSSRPAPYAAIGARPDRSGIQAHRHR